MRALHAALGIAIGAACAASCLLTSNLDELHGGAPKSDSGVVVDTGEACDPTLCGATAMVVPLTSIVPCTTETTDHSGCRKKIHDICVASDPCCAQGGFGPIDFPNPSAATIVCLSGDPTRPTYTAPWSEITAKAPACTSIALAGTHACDVGVHQSALSRAYESGIFQVANADGTALILGLATVNVIVDQSVQWTDLTAADPGCTFPNMDKQACTHAAHKYCTGPIDNGISGFGPVAFTTASASLSLACVN
jgi:hypothetical protein